MTGNSNVGKLYAGIRTRFSHWHWMNCHQDDN